METVIVVFINHVYWLLKSTSMRLLIKVSKNYVPQDYYEQMHLEYH